MPTLKQLDALHWIAALGSFERAAERLGTTQSAVSKRIHELEAALGVEIFDRSQRGARLTPTGEAVLATAGDMLDLRDRLLDFAGQDPPSMRRLRFGVTELTAMTWLPASSRGCAPPIPGSRWNRRSSRARIFSNGWRAAASTSSSCRTCSGNRPAAPCRSAASRTRGSAAPASSASRTRSASAS